jgi:hypothetical protein
VCWREIDPDEAESRSWEGMELETRQHTDLPLANRPEMVTLPRDMGHSLLG